MKPEKYSSKIKTKVVYKNNDDDQPGNSTSADNYDFTAKFKKNKLDPSKNSKLSNPSKTTTNNDDNIPQNESLIIEPQHKLTLLNKKQPTKAFKFFFKMYLFESNDITPFIFCFVLFALCLGLGISVHVNSTKVVTFSVDYSQKFRHKMQNEFSGTV